MSPRTAVRWRHEHRLTPSILPSSISTVFVTPLRLFCCDYGTFHLAQDSMVSHVSYFACVCVCLCVCVCVCVCLDGFESRIKSKDVWRTSGRRWTSSRVVRGRRRRLIDRRTLTQRVPFIHRFESLSRRKTKGRKRERDKKGRHMEKDGTRNSDLADGQRFQVGPLSLRFGADPRPPIGRESVHMAALSASRLQRVSSINKSPAGVGTRTLSPSPSPSPSFKRKKWGKKDVF